MKELKHTICCLVFTDNVKAILEISLSVPVSNFQHVFAEITNKTIEKIDPLCFHYILRFSWYQVFSFIQTKSNYPRVILLHKIS